MINPFPVFHDAEIILLKYPCENKNNNVCLSYSPDIFSIILKSHIDCLMEFVLY